MVPGSFSLRVAEREAKRMMVCVWCGAEFMDGRGLSAHMRTKHPGAYLKRGYRAKYTPDNAQFWVGGDDDDEDEDDD